jgi:hypothetical protein
MSLFKSEEVNKKLADFGIIMKYMPFLQEHGFSEFGKGQLAGKMELLKEGFSDPSMNRSEQRFNHQISISQADPGTLQDNEDQVVQTPRKPFAIASPNLEDSMNMRQDFDDGEKNRMGIKKAERTDVHNTLGQSRGRGLLPENNKWNFKNEDESSWITRIRKLADM